MKLNTIKDKKGARTKSKLLGRGIGSGKGKTCGKGHKGQRARAGCIIKGFEGGQTPIQRRLPKRGFKSRAKGKRFYVLNFSDINRLVEAGKIKEGDVITAKTLVKLGMVKNDRIKLLGKGELKYKVDVDVARYSRSALDKLGRSSAEK